MSSWVQQRMLHAVSISVVLPYWNNSKYLDRCLISLAKQTLKPTQIIIVNDGSSNFPAEINTYNLPLKVIHLQTHVGFAKANNEAIKHVQNDWVALLNLDAFPEPRWLEHLIKATKAYPGYSFFASKQLQYHNPNLIDGAGDSYHLSGLIWRRGFNLPVSLVPNEPCEVFSSCAAAALYSRKAFEEVGGFDEDFFSYVEDVDLGFRLRLKNYKCLYVPSAIVHHVGSASTGGRHSDFAIYYGHRNLVWAYFKNMPLLLLVITLPYHLLMNILTLLNFSLQGKAKVIFKAKYDAIKGLPKIWRKRRYIQKHKKVVIISLWHIMDKNFSQKHWSK